MPVIWKYLKENWLMSIVFFYAIISTFLFSFTSIDICIPCFWKMIFHSECPGCGMTRAFKELLHLDFYGAYKMNKLIFIVLPAIIYYITSDFIRFSKKNKETQETALEN